MNNYAERKPNMAPTLAEIAGARNLLDALAALNRDDPAGWGILYSRVADILHAQCLAYYAAAKLTERAGIPLN